MPDYRWTYCALGQVLQSSGSRSCGSGTPDRAGHAYTSGLLASIGLCPRVPTGVGNDIGFCTAILWVWYRLTKQFIVGLIGGLTVLLLIGPVSAQPTSSVDELIEQGRQVGVDAELMQQVATRAERQGLDAASTAELLVPSVRLAEQGLPADLVLQKALEGLAKRVPPPRIHPVLQQMASHTEQAGQWIGAWTEQPDVQALMGADGPPDAAVRAELARGVAQARMQDVPAPVVQELLDGLPANTTRRPIPPGGVATALQVLPELPMNGTSEAAVRLLTTALDAGYRSADLRQLPAAMRIAQRQTQRPPGALARGAAQAIANGTPAADVLGQLFDGDVPGGGPPGDVGSGPPGNGGGPPGNIPPGQGKPPDTGPPGGRGGGSSGNGGGR